MSNQKSKLSYNIGAYYITDDEQHELRWEQEPYIDLADDMWVKRDVDGEFCIILKQDKNSSNSHEVEGERNEQLLEKYEEQIQEAVDEMTSELLGAYKKLFPDDDVFVDDTQFYNVHKGSLDLLAMPWSNTYILKWITFNAD